MADLLKFIEVEMILNVIVFPLSTLLIIQTVKRFNFDLVDNAVKNPIVPDINLNLFSKLRKEYTLSTGKKLLPIINKISQYGLFAGFIVLFAISTYQEMTKY